MSCEEPERRVKEEGMGGEEEGKKGGGAGLTDRTSLHLPPYCSALFPCSVRILDNRMSDRRVLKQQLQELCS